VVRDVSRYACWVWICRFFLGGRESRLLNLAREPWSLGLLARGHGITCGRGGFRGHSAGVFVDLQSGCHNPENKLINCLRNFGCPFIMLFF
jgi:hypothetical protein